MENHRNRPEVAAALAGRPGGDIRNSPTLGVDFIYAAAPLAGGGVVRRALTLAESNAALEIWRKRFLGGFVFSLAAILGVGLLLARLLARPLEMAAAGAERFAAGHLDTRLKVSGAAEIRQLLSALNHMASELDSRFRQLARQSAEISAVVDNMAEGLLAIDAAGLVTLVNPSARSLLGVGEDAVGRAAAAVFRQPELLDLLRDAAASGTPPERDLRLSFENGAEDRLVHAHAARMREGGGGPDGTLAVLHDVTRLRRLEMVRRDFIANVSHELRTPVTSIQGSLEALLDGGLDDREAASGFLDMGLRNVRRLGSIIGNLLLLAGMESGDPEEKGLVAPSPVEPVLEEAVAVCREASEARKVEVKVECEAGLQADMNRKLVVHALVNLIDNAVKYGPEGGVIVISARRDGNEARIRVADQGPGLAPGHQARVFERFYRVDGNRRLREGSGLGLALVKHIAQAQGGRITLESSLGVGSVFTLSLPAAPELTR
jgi:two-component system phosphate regulon sensor histidine kinase PhoR